MELNSGERTTLVGPIRYWIGIAVAGQEEDGYAAYEYTDHEPSRVEAFNHALDLAPATERIEVSAMQAESVHDPNPVETRRYIFERIAEGQWRLDEEIDEEELAS